MTAVWLSHIKLHFNVTQKTPVFLPVRCVLVMCVSLEQHSNRKLIILQKLCDHLPSAALQLSNSVERVIFREKNATQTGRFLEKVGAIIQ